MYGDSCAFSHAVPPAMVSHSTSPAPPAAAGVAGMAPITVGRGVRVYEGGVVREAPLYVPPQQRQQGAAWWPSQRTPSPAIQPPPSLPLPLPLPQQQQPQQQPQQSQPPQQQQQQQQEVRGRRTLQSLFVEDMLRAELLLRESIANFRPAADDPAVKGLPPTVHRYHSLLRMDAQPLPGTPSRTPPSLGFPTQAYRCTGLRDGCVYLLRQVENIRNVSDAGKHLAEVWQHLHHPSIVGLRDVFISSEIGSIPC